MKFLKKWLTLFALLLGCTSISKIYTQDTMQQTTDTSLVKNVLDGFKQFYTVLSESEQQDLTHIFNGVVGIGSSMQEYCDGTLKPHNVMLSYKQYKKLDQLCLNASFGCTIKNNDPIVCRNSALLDTFECESFLQEPILKEFNDQLSPKEQEELKAVVLDMFTFCKTIVQELTILLNRYPSIEAKLQQLMAETDQEFVVTIGFDLPFPSITYKIA